MAETGKDKSRAGFFLGLGWSVLAVAAATALMSLDAGQMLAGTTLILSAVAAFPLTAALLEKQSGLGGGARLALAAIFAGLAGLSLAQNPPKFPHAKPAAPAAAKTLLEAGGDFGNLTTKAFTVSGAGWDLQWSFDCASLGDSGNFKLSVVKANGGALPDVEKIGDKDAGSVHFLEAGTFQLKVVSECRWNIKVTG